ncbi:lactonase family protein [Microbacterium sp. Marseille-Q6965]|uniref:lactonase family protein n=1 Tax=Microbacterium sp. Marseille-Q6965 TaxID=2965072 RepID=UPI0021B7B578|nr:lactonase family protein [Microbacterium sp. Marseille-Q6965]
MGSGHTTATVAIGGFTGDGGEAPSGLALHAWRAGTPQLEALIDIPNPTWFEWDAVRRVLFVSQSALTTVTAIAIPGGPESARVLDVIDIGCVNPAHLALAPDRRAVVVACFTGGEVIGIEIDEAGRFVAVRSRVAVAGLAPQATRRNALQSDAEPHQVVFAPGGASFDVPDRAQDVVHRFRWRGGGSFAHDGVVSLRPGSGPRHLVRHPARPEVAYLVGELDNTLAVLRDGPKGFAPQHVQSTLPADVFGDSAAAAIFTTDDGERVFVSNRGHDSLAVFDARTDPLRPRPEGWIPIGGRTPRFCGYLERIGRIALAAQESDAVAFVADVDAELTGEGERTIVAHRAPACVRALAL